MIRFLGPVSEEYQYLDLLRELTGSSAFRADRTGVGTFGKFGNLMRFDLRETFPLLTTKRTFFKGIAEELFWFLRGATCNSNQMPMTCPKRGSTYGAEMPRESSSMCAD